MKEAEILKKGGIGVIPTDTLYGIVACALHEQAVTRVYELKGRTPTKPCIILIPSVANLSAFGIFLTQEREKILSQYWPGPVSVILPCGTDVPEYLHRGTFTLAFRLPDDPQLLRFLEESGPLIAPSANPEGLPPATTTEEAKKYFGDNVDFYIDGGKRDGMPSTIIAFSEDNSVTIVRKGGLVKGV
jgi:L-threonylcarbamoyladenylate synthase